MLKNADKYCELTIVEVAGNKTPGHTYWSSNLWLVLERDNAIVVNHFGELSVNHNGEPQYPYPKSEDVYTDS